MFFLCFWASNVTNNPSTNNSCNIPKKLFFFFFAGQEEATIDYDEGIKITPFNMKEELQTGHFDKQGTFIFDKEVRSVIFFL